MTQLAAKGIFGLGQRTVNRGILIIDYYLLMSIALLKCIEAKNRCL